MDGRGHRLTEFNTDVKADYWWDLSPDGTRIAIRTGTDKSTSFAERPRPAGDHREGWNILTSVNWSADGRGLFVSSYSRRGPVLLNMDLQGNARILWEHPGGVDTYGVPSPDGRHLAMRGWNVDSKAWMMGNSESTARVGPCSIPSRERWRFSLRTGFAPSPESFGQKHSH